MLFGHGSLSKVSGSNVLRDDGPGLFVHALLAIKIEIVYALDVSFFLFALC